MFNIYGMHTYADMLKALQSGVKFGRIIEFNDGTKQFYPVLTADDYYIRWYEYGSSAHEPTARNMEFVITKIFKTDLDSFIRKYVWVF